MARSLTPRDAHALINLVCKEATGQDASIQAVDTSTFVSIGEKILATGVENTLNALSVVIGRTFMAVRPYTSKFGLIEETDTALFKNRVRKISYYSRYALASGDWNTQLFTNLANGFDNGENESGGTPQSTKSMWVQNQAIPLEINFAGLSTWEDSTTVYRDQLKVAFQDESSFNSFVAGILTEKGNDIELQREAFRRITLLNQIGAVYTIAADYPTMKINLTAGYNAKFGTSYTSEELRTTYLKSFVEYMVSVIKQTSRRMEYRTAAFHMPYTKTIDGEEYNVLRHTPRDRQRLFLYTPLLVDAESMVMPEIFNDQYLKIENYEAVDYWQNFNDPAAVDVTPAIPGADAYEGTQVIGSEVQIPYVVGCLFDRDAILVNNYLEDSLATPVEARKRYYNIWWTFARNAINDLTENFVLFTMEDGDDILNPKLSSTVVTVAEGGTVNVTLTGIPEDYEGTLNVTGDGTYASATFNAGVIEIAGDAEGEGAITIVILDSDNNPVWAGLIAVTVTAAP